MKENIRKTALLVRETGKTQKRHEKDKRYLTPF